jgi:hypothetical protein
MPRVRYMQRLVACEAPAVGDLINAFATVVVDSMADRNLACRPRWDLEPNPGRSRSARALLRARQHDRGHPRPLLEHHGLEPAARVARCSGNRSRRARAAKAGGRRRGHRLRNPQRCRQAAEQYPAGRPVECRVSAALHEAHALRGAMASRSVRARPGARSRPGVSSRIERPALLCRKSWLALTVVARRPSTKGSARDRRSH